jgi:sugar-specific transcriptional regulator TrmB
VKRVFNVYKPLIKLVGKTLGRYLEASAFDDNKVRIKITGIKYEEATVDSDKYGNFEEMVKDYINITQGVLTKIKINEKEIPLTYYDEIKDAFFEGGEEIELEFSSRDSVLLTLINQSYEYIKKVRENLENVSQEILLNTPEGHNLLNSIAEGMQALLDILEQTRIYIGINFYESEDLEAIQNIISKLIDAQKNEDFLELSDIIGSEFEKILDIFENLLDKAYNILQ